MMHTLRHELCSSESLPFFLELNIGLIGRMRTPRDSLNRGLCCWTKAFLVNKSNSSCNFEILAKTAQFWISIFWGLILLSPWLYHQIIPRMERLVVGVESHWTQEPRFYPEHSPYPRRELQTWYLHSATPRHSANGIWSVSPRGYVVIMCICFTSMTSILNRAISGLHLGWSLLYVD